MLGKAPKKEVVPGETRKRQKLQQTAGWKGTEAEETMQCPGPAGSDPEAEGAGEQVEKISG